MLTALDLEQAGLVAIVRAPSREGVVEAARALRNGGVRALEVTLSTPDALELLARIRAESPDEAPFHVGAGTILDAADAQRALDAGAQFLVTPTLQLDTIALCRAARIPILCGAMTPTECLAAHRAGADFVKLFPATSLGPDYLRALLAPLPFLKIAPTGGVSLDNLAAWFAAGSALVAVGSELVSGAMLQSGDFAGLELQARRWMRALAAARAPEAGVS